MEELKPILRSDYKELAYKITNCDLMFNLDDTKTTVFAKSSVSVISAGEKFLLNGENLVLKSLKINGADAEFDIHGDLLEVKSPPTTDFILEIKTQINPAGNTSLEGLYKSGETFCTQCEPDGFRKITYFIDRPDNLCVFSTEIKADKNIEYLLSNGNKISEKITDDKKTVKYLDPFPKPCYLFALVAGNFDVLEDNFTTKSGKQVLLQIFTDKGNKDKSKFAMESLKKAMKWDEDRFGFVYDLDIYMLVAVDFFNAGAMENKGLNIFNSKFVLVDETTATDDDFLNVEAVIAHEYFHNWTGNRITCRDWFQLSLKEGLTVFREQEFSMDMRSRISERIKQTKFMRTHQFAEDAGPNSHPIRPEKVVEQNNFYSVTIYEKGAEVIRMLHTIIGEEKFMAGMRLFVERFDGKAATCDDFIDAMQDAANYDLAQFRLWYSQSGTPEVHLERKYNPSENWDKKTTTITMKQKTNPTADQKEKKPLMIPCQTSVGLFVITEKKQEFVVPNNLFGHYYFQNFSAPVKFTEYSRRKEAFTIVENKEYFYAWERLQEIIKQDIVSGNKGFNTKKFLRELSRRKDTPEIIKAELFTLPSEVEMNEYFDHNIPVEKINDRRAYIHRVIVNDNANNIVDELFKESPAVNILTNDAITKRKLRVAYIHLLAHFPGSNKMLRAIYYSSFANMTENIAVLRAVAHCQLECADELLQDFEKRWIGNSLVMDKWLTIQATVPNLDTIKRVIKLFSHSSFDFNNPNRVRALIGAFASQNPFAFNNINGRGYDILTGIVLEIDKKNPQLAARLILPLTMFEKHTPKRRKIMKKSILYIADKSNISDNLREVVGNSLTRSRFGEYY